MPDRSTHVIIGGGLAGAKAAEALREEGFEGRVVLVGAESELPYERPPLSKDYLRGESPREKARVHPGEFYASNDIELLTGTTAEAIDTAAREVTFAGGERVGYDRLLLATGSEPRRLTVPGAELDGVHYLRDLPDADAIAARIAKGGRVAVIGAGWIGSEVAASARQKGLEVALVEMGKVPLERVLGAEVGEVFAQLHRDNGVELHGGVTVEAFEGDGRVERVRLGGGATIDCDFVVVGVGALPRTELASAAGISVGDGILVSKRLETSVEGVFAAGDVACAFHPHYGTKLRVEHWANALNQPLVAARAMLGKPASYERLPYFFSDQFDLGMEYTGHAAGSDDLVFRGDPASREFVAFWTSQGRVLAGMNVNVWDVTEPIGALIRSGEPVAKDLLADTGASLDSLAAEVERCRPA